MPFLTSIRKQNSTSNGRKIKEKYEDSTLPPSKDPTHQTNKRNFTINDATKVNIIIIKPQPEKQTHS